jgi:hypothetical protein
MKGYEMKTAEVTMKNGDIYIVKIDVNIFTMQKISTIMTATTDMTMVAYREVGNKTFPIIFRGSAIRDISFLE